MEAYCKIFLTTPAFIRVVCLFPKRLFISTPLWKCRQRVSATTQMDMFVAEKVGLYKLDILSQRGLGHIKDCIQLVRQNRSISVDIHDIEKFKTRCKSSRSNKAGRYHWLFLY